MTEIVQKLDYDENLELQPEEYVNSPNLTGLISSVHAEANDVEQAIFEIRDEFWLNSKGDGSAGGSAIGTQLETLGEIFGTEREGDSDEDYRARILQQTSAQYSGTPEDIIDAIKGLYGATMVSYDPGYPGTPGTFNIISDVLLTEEQINNLAPAGVNGVSGNNFVLSNGNNFVFSNGNNYTVI